MLPFTGTIILCTSVFLMLSSLILVSRQLLARVRNLEKRKGIPKAELITVIGLILFFSLWFPWNIDTNPMGSEAETYNTQAKCIEIRLTGDNRDGGFCDFLFFGSRHELIYSILILFTRKIFHSGILTMRILVNILNILTAIIIYLLLRRLNLNHLPSVLTVLLYFLIPYKLEFINEPGAENLLFLIVFGVIYYIVSSKDKNYSITFLILNWLLIFTRMEFIFVIPLFHTWYLNKNRITLQKKDYLRIILISLPFLIVLYNFSKIRTLGIVDSGIFPLVTITALFFVFIINRAYKNRDKLREIIETSLLILINIYLAKGENTWSQFTLQGYWKRLLENWFPQTITAIANSSTVFKLFLALSSIGIVFSIIRYKKSSLRKILILSLISIQIFISRTFLLTVDFDGRALGVGLTLFIIPIALLQNKIFPEVKESKRDVDKRMNRRKTIVILIYIGLLCLTLFEMVKINVEKGSCYFFYDAINNCKENESIFFLTGEMNLPLVYSNNNIVPISHTMEGIDKKYDKIILNHSNICWIDYKASDNEGEKFNRLLNKIREILKKDYDVKGKYENSLLITYSLQKKPT